MKLKTLDIAGDVTLCSYSDEDCRRIFFERNSYVLRVVHSYGDDYGGSHVTDECAAHYEEIIPERILVDKGHFCGVCLIAVYDDIGPGFRQTLEEAILRADGRGRQSVRSGMSFSNDDHSRWDYVDIYLMERGEAEKMPDWQG